MSITDEARIERRMERTIDVLDELRQHAEALNWAVKDDDGDSMPYAFTAVKESEREQITIEFDMDEEGRPMLTRTVLAQGSTRLIAEAWLEGLL